MTETTLNALTLADTLQKIIAEYVLYEEGKINAVTLANRIGDLIVRADRLLKREPDAPSPMP